MEWSRNLTIHYWQILLMVSQLTKSRRVKPNIADMVAEQLNQKEVEKKLSSVIEQFYLKILSENSMKEFKDLTEGKSYLLIMSKVH